MHAITNARVGTGRSASGSLAKPRLTPSDIVNRVRLVSNPRLIAVNGPGRTRSTGSNESPSLLRSASGCLGARSSSGSDCSVKFELRDPGSPTSPPGERSSSLYTGDLEADTQAEIGRIHKESANDRIAREVERYSEATQSERQAMGQILANRRGVNRLEENIYVRVLREDQVTVDGTDGVDAYIKNVGDDFVILGIENYIHPGSVINTEEVSVSVPEGKPFPEQVDPEKDGKPNTRAISRR